jgi:hypothetical protein
MQGEAVVGRAGRLDESRLRGALECRIALADIDPSSSARSGRERAVQLEAVRRPAEQESEEGFSDGHLGVPSTNSNTSPSIVLLRACDADACGAARR